MTVRDLYDAALIEINKLEAPSMLLEDYNYLINKAIQQKVNKSYNWYEMNQQATDDLLALKVSTKLDILSDSEIVPNEIKHYYCNMPEDYWHILNCVIQFEDSGSDSCGNKSKSTATLARRLTSDLYPSIINNAYFKPSPKNPYYRVIKSEGETVGTTLASIINPCYDKQESIVMLDLRCGDTDRYKPNYAYIDYLKIPKHVELSYEDLDATDDNTPVMEFPDYICYEIINEFVKLLLENASDPRLETNIPINQTIGEPLQSNK